MTLVNKISFRDLEILVVGMLIGMIITAYNIIPKSSVVKILTTEAEIVISIGLISLVALLLAIMIIIIYFFISIFTGFAGWHLILNEQRVPLMSFGKYWLFHHSRVFKKIWILFSDYDFNNLWYWQVYKNKCYWL